MNAMVRQLWRLVIRAGFVELTSATSIFDGLAFHVALFLGRKVGCTGNALSRIVRYRPFIMHT